MNRVEAQTKERGEPVLVTGAIIERLRHPERFTVRRVAEAVRLRGREEPVDLYAIDMR